MNIMMHILQNVSYDTDEHNNAHFTERFVLYRMNIIMHILQNVSYYTE